MVAMMTWGIHEQGWRKGPWTPEEDKLLSEYISKHGEGRWSSVARCAGLNRTGKSCRLRWVNYLRPGLKRGHLTPQEEGIIMELHALWGNKWSTIARYLPGRTDNEIKNYWRTHFKIKEKCSQKQEKRRQLLKEKREQQQQQRLFQQKQQAREHDISEGNPQNAKQMEETQEKQDTVFAYPTMENQYCVPYMHYQDLSPPWFDSAGDVGLWGGLWNLDEPYGCSNDRINNKIETPHNQTTMPCGGHSHKVTMQNQGRTLYGEGAFNYTYNL